MKNLIFGLISLVGMTSSAYAASYPTEDVNTVCVYYQEFKNFNKVLCAAAAQTANTNAPMEMPKALACIYSTIREDKRICPNAEVKEMDLPEIPPLEGDLEDWQWPANVKPLLEKVNGKALSAVLKLDTAFDNEEYSLASLCNSTDGKLKHTDRILCAPFVKGLTLADAHRVSGDARDIIIKRLKKKIADLEDKK